MSSDAHCRETSDITIDMSCTEHCNVELICTPLYIRQRAQTVRRSPATERILLMVELLLKSLMDSYLVWEAANVSTDTIPDMVDNGKML